MSDHDTADQRPRQRIYDAREAMHEARLSLKVEAMNGHVSLDTRKRYCGVLSAYYDVLREHRGDPALDPDWDERDIDWVDEWATEQVTVQRSAPKGAAYGTKSEQRNKLVSAPVERLKEAAATLDSIARDLGFAAETTDHTPKDEWEMVDLLHLLTTRDQTEPAQEVYDALEIDTGEAGGEDGDNATDTGGAASADD